MLQYDFFHRKNARSFEPKSHIFAMIVILLCLILSLYVFSFANLGSILRDYVEEFCVYDIDNIFMIFLKL